MQLRQEASRRQLITPGDPDWAKLQRSLARKWPGFKSEHMDVLENAEFLRDQAGNISAIHYKLRESTQVFASTGELLRYLKHLPAPAPAKKSTPGLSGRVGVGTSGGRPLAKHTPAAGNTLTELERAKALGMIFEPLQNAQWADSCIHPVAQAAGQGMPGNSRAAQSCLRRPHMPGSHAEKVTDGADPPRAAGRAGDGSWQATAAAGRVGRPFLHYIRGQESLDLPAALQVLFSEVLTYMQDADEDLPGSGPELMSYVLEADPPFLVVEGFKNDSQLREVLEINADLLSDLVRSFCLEHAPSNSPKQHGKQQARPRQQSVQRAGTAKRRAEAEVEAEPSDSDVSNHTDSVDPGDPTWTPSAAAGRLKKQRSAAVTPQQPVASRQQQQPPSARLSVKCCRVPSDPLSSCTGSQLLDAARPGELYSNDAAGAAALAKRCSPVTAGQQAAAAAGSTRAHRHQQDREHTGQQQQQGKVVLIDSLEACPAQNTQHSTGGGAAVDSRADAAVTSRDTAALGVLKPDPYASELCSGPGKVAVGVGKPAGGAVSTAAPHQAELAATAAANAPDCNSSGSELCRSRGSDSEAAVGALAATESGAFNNMAPARGTAHGCAACSGSQGTPSTALPVVCNTAAAAETGLAGGVDGVMPLEAERRLQQMTEQVHQLKQVLQQAQQERDAAYTDRRAAEMERDAARAREVAVYEEMQKVQHIWGLMQLVAGVSECEPVADVSGGKKQQD